jgi:hypothetical protein
MLARNVENRPHKIGQTRRLRDDIAGGLWQVNGESLVFAVDGSLNDGQHRLRAVADGGVAIRTVAVFGVSRESRFTLDLGRSRNPSDILHFQGFRNPFVLALRWLSKSAVIDRASRDQALADAANWAVTEGGPVKELLPQSPLAFLRYILRPIDRAKADEFLKVLVSGEGPSTHVALTARRYFAALSTRQREAQLALALRALLGRTRRSGLSARTVRPVLSAERLVQSGGDGPAARTEAGRPGGRGETETRGRRRPAIAQREARLAGAERTSITWRVQFGIAGGP